MKFAHMADVHIGGWRDPKLKDLNTQAFFEAVDICTEEKVDFIVIAGDLFNTALPDINRVKDVVRRFRQLKEKDIPVYLIPGSHDFSPSGKTMLDVLEEAGLCTNVVKASVVDEKLRLQFTKDPKTGAKITGLLGRRGTLETSYYEQLDRKHLEEEEGFKIFLFHTALTELKPKNLSRMTSAPISLLPKGFDYYAGGHVHIVEKIDLPGYNNVVYPGPLFPNNFSELEELKGGGFYIYDDGKLIRKDIVLRNIVSITLDAQDMLAEQVAPRVLEKASDVGDSIVLIRLKGNLSGSIADIDYRLIHRELYNKGAYFVMRNTYGLTSKEFEEIKVEAASAQDVEERLIEEHAGQMETWPKDKEKDMIKRLMTILSGERKEGEKVYEFEERIKEEIKSLLNI